MINPSTSLRAMEPVDFGAIAALLMRAFLPHEPRFALPSAHFLRLSAESCPPASWVAEQAGRIVGVVFGHSLGRTGWLGPLAVSPDQQQNGIGKILCQACLHGLRQSGCKVVGLDSRADQALVRFYQRCGFILSANTVDGLKELSSENERGVDLSWYSRYDRASFKIKWFALQQETAPGFDYWPTLERLQGYGCGDAMLWSRRDRVLGGMILQHGARGINDSAAVVRLQVCMARESMAVESWLSEVEAAIHNRYPECTHVFVRVHASFATALEQMGFRLLRSGYRFSSELFPPPLATHEWIWE